MKYFNSLLFVSVLVISSMGTTKSYADFYHGKLPLGDREKVMEAINKLFDGMRKGDSALVSSVFMPNANLASISRKDGSSVFHEGKLADFLNAVGTPHEKVWDEKIWDPKIEVDDNMATVWVKYAFYHGGEFSHCGVNAFQLFNTDSGWKIVNITDTRRKNNCEQP